MTLTKTRKRSATFILPKAFLFSGIFTGLFLFTSCTSLDTLVVNVEKPAQITLPNNINNIVIVDNSVPQAEDIGHVEYIRGRRSDALITVNTDSINYMLTASLFDQMGDKEYFDDVIFYEHPVRDDINFEDVIPLNTTLATEICSDNKADAIISIDRFLVSTVSHDEEFDFGTIVKYLDARMDVRFQVYSKDGEAISPPLYINDSIYWVATYNQNIPLGDSIPSREEAMKEAAQYMAGKLADALAPYWNNELRWYFSDIKAANKMMGSNDWAGALSLWRSAYDKETKNLKKKARLANNIALAYELSDELKDALKWITISRDLFAETEETGVDTDNLRRVTEYQNDLLVRYNDFKLLDIRHKESK